MALTSKQQENLQNWINDMEKFSIGELRKAIEKDDLEVGLIILTVVGIDCLGAYLAGIPDVNRRTFKDFLQKYFPLIYQQHQMIDDIYILRCGLVHQYKINHDKFYFVRDESEEHHLAPVVIEGKRRIIFNRKIFAKDFIKAWEDYSKEIFENDQLAENVLKKVKQRLVVSDIPAPDEPSGYMGVTGSVSGLPDTSTSKY